MEVLVTAISALGSSVIDFIAMDKMTRYSRLPDWLTAKDFQRDDYTMEIILGGLAVAFVVLMITIAVIGVKKAG